MFPFVYDETSRHVERMRPTALRWRGTPGRSRPVRLVCFGEIHMAFRAIERLAPVLHEAASSVLAWQRGSRKRSFTAKREARNDERRHQGANAG